MRLSGVLEIKVYVIPQRGLYLSIGNERGSPIDVKSLHVGPLAYVSRRERLRDEDSVNISCWIEVQRSNYRRIQSRERGGNFYQLSEAPWALWIGLVHSGPQQNPEIRDGVNLMPK